MRVVVTVEDPRVDDVCGLLEQHLTFAHEVTPASHVHALDVDRLLDPAVTFFTARRDGELLGVGALKELDPSHGEIKSMHTAASARRQGVARMMVEHLLAEASTRRYRRVSLETGTSDDFVGARSLYAAIGFTPCEPFADYTVNPYSTCMSIELPLA